MVDLIVTKKVKLSPSELPSGKLVRVCLCGNTDIFFIGWDREEARPCPKCGKRLYYRTVTHIYQIEEE